MAIDFPNSPTTNQTYTANGRTWIYDGQKWGLQTVDNSVVLDGLSNVEVPSPASGDFLKWNGTAWVNDPINLGTDTVGSYIASLTAGTGITVSGSTISTNLTAGTGVTVSGATISIGQAVATNSNVQFNQITFQQNVCAKLRMYTVGSGGYEIGVQSATHYFRTDKQFAWYLGGSHNDGELNNGGGTTLARLLNDGGFYAGGYVTGPWMSANEMYTRYMVIGPNGQYSSQGSTNLQINTTTAFGYGCNADHTGFRIAASMCGWSTARLDFWGSTDWNSYGNLCFTILPGAVYANTYMYYSDQRLKTDIEPMTDALSAVKALKPKRFRMKVDEYVAPKRYGFIAQDVEEVLPDLVTSMQVSENRDEDKLTMDANGLVAVSIKALQELIDKVEALEGAVYGN